MTELSYDICASDMMPSTFIYTLSHHIQRRISMLHKRNYHHSKVKYVRNKNGLLSALDDVCIENIPDENLVKNFSEIILPFFFNIQNWMYCVVAKPEV